MWGQSYRVVLDREDAEREVDPRESDVIRRLDERLWGGERLVDVEHLRRREYYPVTDEDVR